MEERCFEINYEIEAIFDEYGEFPLHCATLLFDLLNINGNVVIKNQYSIKPEKSKVVTQYIGNQTYFYEWPKRPEGNYCVWLKQSFQTNQEILNILKLQGTYLTYIVPTESFDWENFLENWEKDERYLLFSGQSSFICNVIDMERTLNINFDTTVYSAEKIMDIIREWEKSIFNTSESLRVERTVEEIRGKYGILSQVRLRFF